MPGKPKYSLRLEKYPHADGFSRCVVTRTEDLLLRLPTNSPHGKRIIFQDTERERGEEQLIADCRRMTKD